MAATNATAVPQCETVALLAGQTLDVGFVKVCPDSDLTITLKTDDPWCIKRAHVAVEEFSEDIPQTKSGNPIPGRFPYKFYNDTCQNEVKFENIPSAGDPNVIAAHAEVKNKYTGAKETAWGDGFPFPGANWATYFVYPSNGQPPTPALNCGDDDSSKCVFVTSTQTNGKLGGLAGADQICQDLADASSLVDTGTYKAWLSDTTASPNTRFAQASVPYKLVDGTMISSNYAGLIDGGIDAPIKLDENGDEQILIPPGLSTKTANVWTATNERGETIGTSATTCNDWTTPNQGVFATAGRSACPDASVPGGCAPNDWTKNQLLQCPQRLRLYCFQQ